MASTHDLYYCKNHNSRLFTNDAQRKCSSLVTLKFTSGEEKEELVTGKYLPVAGTNTYPSVVTLELLVACSESCSSLVYKIPVASTYLRTSLECPDLLVTSTFMSLSLDILASQLWTVAKFGEFQQTEFKQKFN